MSNRVAAHKPDEGLLGRARVELHTKPIAATGTIVGVVLGILTIVGLVFAALGRLSDLVGSPTILLILVAPIVNLVVTGHTIKSAWRQGLSPMTLSPSDLFTLRLQSPLCLTFGAAYIAIGLTLLNLGLHKDAMAALSALSGQGEEPPEPSALYRSGNVTLIAGVAQMVTGLLATIQLARFARAEALLLRSLALKSEAQAAN